jgi:hypothetical protein
MRKTLIGMVAAFATVVVCGASLRADVSTDDSRRTSGLAALKVGDHFVIEPPAAQFVHKLDEREHREQLRDWAVLATVARLGATPTQAAAATYELPPARLPYLDDLYTFEYGRGRRVYLGNRVLLFHDAGDPDPVATIGRLADRARMENGKLPATAEVYLITDRRNDGLIEVVRAPDVASAALFSPAYGYVEGDGDTAVHLADWLNRADDLTFVRIDPRGHLKLGGRRFAHTRTLEVDVEDVAALYQAHEILNAPRAEARASLRALPREAQSALDKLDALGATGALTDSSFNSLTKTLASYIPDSMAASSIEAIKKLLKPAPPPEFSLDPQWLPSDLNPQHPQFLDALRAFAADPCAELRSIASEARTLAAQEPDDTRRTWRARLALDLTRYDHASAADCAQIKQYIAPKLLEIVATIESAAPAKWDTAIASYYQEQARWASTPRNSPQWRAARFTSAALEFREAGAQVQCARYDGTAGTNVGMTLFYTDLLAKLWESTDYGLSTPTLEVPGFQSAPRIDLPASFAAAMSATPNTRVWFGPRMNRVSHLTSDNITYFTFEHRFSRIYAAGSNSALPGVESEPPENSRRTLGWWDRHFDDVADYEPQYHRQNQIMKWSLITAALLDSPTARYLHKIQVDRSAKFAVWQQALATKLRFHDGLPLVHASIKDRECIPILASYEFESAGSTHYIAGGVGMPGRTAVRETPSLKLTGEMGARKPYVPENGGAAANTATRGHPVAANDNVHFEHAEHAIKVTPEGPIQLGTPEVRYQAGARPRELVIQEGSGRDAVGELSFTTEPDLVRGRWVNEAVESARQQETVARTLETADTAAKTGHVTEAATLYDEEIVRPATMNDEARLGVSDVAHDRPKQLLDRLQRMAPHHEQIDPGPREALVTAIRVHESPAVAGRVEAMLERGAALDGDGERIVVRDGRAEVMRDVEDATLSQAHRVQPTDLSDGKVYFDGQVRAAHDGLFVDTGGRAARWLRVRDVRIDELDASAFGALPDRALPDQLRMPSGEVYASPPTPANGMPAFWPKAYLIRQCDADHKTPSTSDDC